MKKSILFIFVVAVILICASAQFAGAAVLLSDDFSSGSIDTSKWNPQLINYFGDPIAPETSIVVDGTGGDLAVHGVTASRDAAILDSKSNFTATHNLTFDIMRASTENANYYASYYMGSGHANQMLYGIDWSAYGGMAIHVQQGSGGWADWKQITTVPATYDTWYTVQAMSTEEAGSLFRKEDVDLLVVCEGTYFPDYMPIQTMEYLPGVPVLVLLSQPEDTIPVDMDYPRAITDSFGLVGAVQLTGAMTKMGKKFEVLAGALNEESTLESIERYARVALVRRLLRFLRLGIIGHTFQGMYDLELDKTKLKSDIGPSVIYIEMAEILSLWKDIQEQEAEKLAGELASKYVPEGPGKSDIANACRLTLAMEKVADKYRLDGLSHLCQFLIHVETRTTPCLGTARLIQKGIMTTCEGDLGGLVAMCILHMLGGKSTFFGEWGMYDTSENAMLLFHHGASNPELAKDPSNVNITPTGER